MGLTQFAEDTDITGDYAFTIFHGTVDSFGNQFAMWGEGRGDEAQKLALGCWMLFAMPEQGVNEALGSLRDILAFHFEPIQPALLRPTVMHKGKGKIVGTSERPDLIISD